jgi:hypothetical protein
VGDTLTPDAFDRAADYLRGNARDLEQARFGWAFEQEGTAEVLARLGRYQNPDGGYGRGLEPDLRTEHSSVVATTMALRLFRELGVSDDHGRRIAAADYLVSTFDSRRNRWRIVPSGAGDAPHAPWWDQDGLEETFDGFAVNPTASVVAFLFDVTGSHRSRALPFVLQSAYTVLLRTVREATAPLSVNDLECLVDLATTAQLPREDRAGIVARVGALIERSIERDRARWGEYAVRPLDVVTSRESPFYERIAGLVDAHLDALVAGQQADGSWEPHWPMSPFYETCPEARVEWRGVCTLESLLLLRSFDRLPPGR